MYVCYVLRIVVLTNLVFVDVFPAAAAGYRPVGDRQASGDTHRVGNIATRGQSLNRGRQVG